MRLFRDKTISSKSRLLPRTLSRSLHVFDPYRTEIVIGHNSALFATAASLIEHTKPKHPDLHFIKTPHWIDDVLPEYFNCLWGQTIYGLPKFARDLFHLYDKDHDPTKLITLGQFIGLRNVVYNVLLNDFKVPFYEGIPTIELTPEHGFRVTINKNGQIEEKSFGSDAYFYNWYRVPRLHNLKNKKVPNRSASLLYTKPRESAYDVLIILGAGLQTAWVERNFKKSRIICLRNPNDEIPRLPANAEVNYDRIEFVDINSADIEPLDKEGAIFLSAPDLKGGSVRGEFYEGIGYEPARSLPKNFPKVSYEYIRDRPEYSKFISTKNVPSGSLMESYLMWIELTNNLQWGYEPFAYHTDEFPLMLISASNKKGIHLPDVYFNALESYIQSLDNPDPEVLQLDRLVEIYRYVVDNNDESVKKFREVLMEMDKKRLKVLDMSGKETDNNDDLLYKGIIK
jgi:hypothetical protein